MPIIYVNPAGKRRHRRFGSSVVSGKARVGRPRRRARHALAGLPSRFAMAENPSKKKRKSKKRRMPPALAAYWAKKRKKSAKKTKKRKSSMAKKKRKHRRKHRRARRRTYRLRHKRRGRRRGRKSRRRAALLGFRRKRRKKNPAKRRRRRGAKRSHRRGRKRSHGRKRRARRRSSRARAARKGWRRRKRFGKYTPKRPSRKSMARRRRRRSSHRKTIMGHAPGIVMANPSRRRRRKSRRRARRYYHRRHYRRNPGFGGIGTFLMDAAKKAVPVLASLIGIRAVLKTIGPRIPLNLGTFQGPAMSAAALVGANYACKKVGFLAKHREAIMLGAGINLVEQLISAFAPDSVKSMIGMSGLSDYVAVSDYLMAGSGQPIDDSIALADYVQVGINEELGLDQELGIDQELGGLGSDAPAHPYGQGMLGGMAASAMKAPIGAQAFLAPVPNRSFVQQVPGTGGSAYDDPDILYTGIFGGGFGG